MERNKKNKSEVIAMSIFEYNKEEEERKLREAEFEGGMQIGIQKGIQKGIQQEKDFNARVIVKMLQKDGFSKEEIRNRLREYYQLTENDIDRYL